VVAFQVGLQLMYFPVALAARSVSVTLLPVLSRLAAVRDLQRFGDELARGLSLALFVVLPAAVFYLGMAGPIASSFAFGEMATPRGVTLLTVATGALAIGVPAVVALTVLDGAAVIFLLGLAISAGNAAGAWHLGRRLLKWLPRTGGPVVSPALRAAGAALLMVVPARAVVVLTDELLDGGWKHGVGLALAGATAAGVYLLAHRRWRSPELRSWVSSLRSSDQGAC
jgi:peptidoglycan biosynthesis protein MviN/MurJ (putative lipid II flippase)